VSAAGIQSAVAADSVRSATVDLLRRREMTTIFGNPGSTELGLLRDFPPDFRYVLGLHEGVAVGIADGYAQASARPAFVNLHSATGVGNAMGAVVNAFHNRAPLVITAGNQDRRHLELEPYLFARSTALMAPYVKHSHQPARAQDVPAAIDRAWALARTPPCGPTFVSVPSDDWDAPLAASPPAAGEILTAASPDAAVLDELAERIEASASPGLIVGDGVDRDAAWEAVITLAERLNAPVWTAPQSPRLGFPEDHRHYQGHLAPGRASAAAQLAGLDLALVLGAPVFAFLPYQPGGPRLPPLIHVTDDAEEAARAPAALRVVAGVRPVAEGLNERVAPRGGTAAAPPSRPRPPAPPAASPIAPAFLMAALAHALPQDAVVVEESPSNRNELREHVWIRRPASFFATASGGLGFAMPAAVGIKLAWPSRPVVCLIGDGSALYAPQSLWSAVQVGAAVAFVVVDNGRYAILESVAQFAGVSGLPSMALPGLDLVALAQSLGCRAIRVTDPQDLGPALAEAIAAQEPMLVDVVVDPAPVPLLRSEPV